MKIVDAIWNRLKKMRSGQQWSSAVRGLRMVLGSMARPPRPVPTVLRLETAGRRRRAPDRSEASCREAAREKAV